MQLKFLDPGQLRTALTVEQASEAPDGQGGFSVVWDVVVTIWAMVEPLAGRSTLFAERTETLSSHRIWVRWRNDIARGMRLTGSGRIYRIDSIEDADGSRRYLVIKATEVFA